MRFRLASAIALVLAGAATPAAAGTIVFTGSRPNVDAPGTPAPRCGDRATITIVNNPPVSTSSGVSNLGSFTPSLSHCIQVPIIPAEPNVFDLGEFSSDFGAGMSCSAPIAGP